MATSRSSSRRSAYTLLFIFAVISLVLFTRWPSDSKHSKQGVKVISKADGLVTHVRESGTEGLGISQELLSGDVIMPKLGNETAKYTGSHQDSKTRFANRMHQSRARPSSLEAIPHHICTLPRETDRRPESHSTGLDASLPAHVSMVSHPAFPTPVQVQSAPVTIMHN